LGQVEFVADPDVVDAETAWFVEQYGGGCMIVTEVFGRVFLDETEENEDFEFVSRSAPG